VRTLLLLLLIGLISFSFVSRTVEYVVVRRETERLGSYYRSIGTLKPTDKAQTDVSAGAALLADNPYISYTDSLRFCSCVLKDLYNADLGGYSSDTPTKATAGYNIGLHLSDVWFYGALEYKNYSEREGIYRFEFVIDRVEAGFPKYVKDLYRRERVSMIFQAFQLFPLLTAVENVCYPMEMSGVAKTAAKERAAALLHAVGIGRKLYKRYPANLSGGEQQRIAIARALSTSAKVLLADEPTGNLDTANGGRVMKILLRLAHEEGYCVVVVTHDLAIAGSADRTFRLTDGVLSVER